MPGTSGIEVLETMRRRGDLQRIIVISDRTDALTRKRAHAAGGLADDQIGTELEHRPRAGVAQVYEILKREEPEPDESRPIRSPEENRHSK